MLNRVQPHVDLPLGLISSATKPKSRGRPAFKYKIPSSESTTPSRPTPLLSSHSKDGTPHSPSPYPSKSESHLMQTPTTTSDERNTRSGLTPQFSDVSTSTGTRQPPIRVIYETGQTRVALANLSPEPCEVDVAGIRVEALAEPVYKAHVAKRFLSDTTADIRNDPTYTAVEIDTGELPMFFDSLVRTLRSQSLDSC